MTKKLALGLALTLAGCGGGGLDGIASGGSTTGGGTSSESLGGVWSGTISTGSATHNALALISENGAGALIDQTSGTINRISALASGTAISGTYRGYASSGTLYGSGSSTDTGTLSGTVAQASTLDGTYTSSSGNGSNSFALGFNSTQYDQAASFTAIAGTYAYNYITDGGNLSYSLTVTTSGAITGTVSNGCGITGTVGIPDGTVNLYTLNLTEACNSSSSTNFTGFATLMPASGNATATLELEYDDGSVNAVQATATRQ